ncbi:uncharacterized protein LOC124929156 [Impatiens glandulifera]|uniref:uncharacterized protein LOC124929156 n=1 Tax=Impatiens glandulifera TaxID=253017 RepID=UPI001FB14C47|nr:uncharacterized protein LOC124929156 [Impatiens glandulifera]XP_047325402.1 uncharacterized protein LOC124929156 [Impatiens glandulifera]
MTCFCNCRTPASTPLIGQKSRQLAKEPCKACDKVNVDGIETQTTNMLGTVGTELSFVNPELTWKTATKGSRTTTRRSRRGVGSWANNSVLLDARSPQRDEFSVSESEKHGVAVLGRRFSDHVEQVPFKKRRVLPHSSSPLARNQSSSLKSKKIKIRNGKGASGQCFSEDSTYAVFSLKDVDNSFTDGKPPKLKSAKVHVDFSGIALLAATACSSMINDNWHSKDESISYLSSTAKHIDSVVSMELLKESVTSEDAVSKFVKDPQSEQEPSGAQGIPSADLLKADDVSESEAVNQSDSVKYVKLHWDLNTEIEAWEKPSDVPFLNIQNDALSSPDGGNHSERLQKLEGSDMCGYPGLPLTSLGQYPVDRKLCIVDNSSSEILDMSSLNGIMQTKENYTLQDGQSQIHHVVSIGACSDPLIEGKVTNMEGIKHVEERTVPPGFPEMLKTEACQMVTDEYSLNKSGIMSSFHESLEHHDSLYVLDATGGGRQIVLAENVPSQDKEAATPDYLQSNKSSDKPTTSSAFNNGESSCKVSNEMMTEIQTGYESPFEDGELREDPILSVEGNEVEGEIECMDNGENLEAEHNASNCCPPEFSSLNCQIVRKGDSPENVVQDGIGDEMKELTQSTSSNTKFSGRDQLPEGCEPSSGRSVATKVISLSHTFVYNSIDESHDDKAKASEGKRLFSHLEGSSRSDVLHWKDAVYARPNNLDKACVQDERESGSDVRRVSSLQCRDQKEEDCTGSLGDYWGSRSNNYLSSYRPLDTDYYSRQNDSKPRGSNYTGQRRPITYSSKGPHRPSLTRSPVNREGHYVEHRRMVSLRDDSRNSRTRGSRHGISPVSVRGADFSRPHPKSRSRSRTGSPPVRHLQRERTMGAKRHSRSPDLRFEARVERKWPSFAKYPSKWTDNRNDDADRFSRRSPGRMFKRSHRFDRLDSTERTEFDDNSRRMGFPGRFNNLTGRGSKYDGCDDGRRKYSDKYEMIHRVRRYDSNGEIKRFRYDAEGLEDHNIHDENKFSRSSDRRDITKKSTRKERGPSRYSSGRTNTSSPKYSGIRDYSEDVSPKKR